MKTTFFYRNFLAGSLLLLASCSKGDKTNPPATPPDLTGRISKIVQIYPDQIVDQTQNYVFTYNADGTVAQIDRSDAGGPFSTVYFNQQADYGTRTEISNHNGGTGVVDSFRYDSLGRLFEEYTLIGTQYQFESRYFYRADGKIDYTEERSGFGSNANVKYSWEGGDNIKIDYGFVTVAYSYYMQEANRPGDAQMISDLLNRGRVSLPNAHLVSKENFPGEVPAEFSYVFKGGRIDTVTRINEDSYGVVKQILTYDN